MEFAAGLTVGGLIERGGALELVVTDADGQPIRGAFARVWQDDREITAYLFLSTMGGGRLPGTDANGKLSLGNLEAGEYVVERLRRGR